MGFDLNIVWFEIWIRGEYFMGYGFGLIIAWFEILIRGKYFMAKLPP